MPTLSRAEVQKIATLCRLALTEQEEERLAVDLTSILGYVEALQQLDTAKVEPTNQVAETVNVLREDVVFGCPKPVTDGLVDAVPHKEGCGVKVQNVL